MEEFQEQIILDDCSRITETDVSEHIKEPTKDLIQNLSDDDYICCSELFTLLESDSDIILILDIRSNAADALTFKDGRVHVVTVDKAALVESVDLESVLASLAVGPSRTRLLRRGDYAAVVIVDVDGAADAAAYRLLSALRHPDTHGCDPGQDICILRGGFAGWEREYPSLCAESERGPGLEASESCFFDVLATRASNSDGVFSDPCAKSDLRLSAGKSKSVECHLDSSSHSDPGSGSLTPITTPVITTTGSTTTRSENTQTPEASTSSDSDPFSYHTLKEGGEEYRFPSTDTIDLIHGPMRLDDGFGARGDELEELKRLHSFVWRRAYVAIVSKSKVEGKDDIVGLVGLINLGNSCFLSAVLQALLHTFPLRELLCSQSFVPHVNPGNPATHSVPKGAFPSILAALFLIVWTPLRERPNVLRLSALRKAVEMATGNFADNLQHDAQECLLMILDAIGEDLNQVPSHPLLRLPRRDGLKAASLPKNGRSASPDRSKESVVSQADAAWAHSRRLNSSPVDAIFSAQEVSETVCASCGHRSFSFAPLKVISLEIPTTEEGKTLQLKDCLWAYYGRESLEEERGWRCEVCKAPRAATKQLFLHRAPPVLVIHFKRFWGTETKIRSAIEFPGSELRMDAYRHAELGGDDAAYTLYAVINHSGTMEKGHYTAAANSKELPGWVFFDDEFLHELKDGVKELQNENAYVLFYQRQQ